MQRVAFLSFVGVIVLLMAFTVHESGKLKATGACKGRSAAASFSGTEIVAARR